MTSINDALVFSINPAVPFGGRGDSGYGRKQGEEGLREFAYPHSFTARPAPPSSRRPPSQACGRDGGSPRRRAQQILAESAQKSD